VYGRAGGVGEELVLDGAWYEERGELCWEGLLSPQDQ